MRAVPAGSCRIRRGVFIRLVSRRFADADSSFQIQGCEAAGASLRKISEARVAGGPAVRLGGSDAAALETPLASGVQSGGAARPRGGPAFWRPGEQRGSPTPRDAVAGRFDSRQATGECSRRFQSEARDAPQRPASSADRRRSDHRRDGRRVRARIEARRRRARHRTRTGANRSARAIELSAGLDRRPKRLARFHTGRFGRRIRARAQVWPRTLIPG